MRSNLDGSLFETLIESVRGNPIGAIRPVCVGVLSIPTQAIYWTQKGPHMASAGATPRLASKSRNGENRCDRSDSKIFFDHLPEPIDLELRLKIAFSTGPIAAKKKKPRARQYSQSPSLDPQTPSAQIVLTHLMEGDWPLRLDVPAIGCFYLTCRIALFRRILMEITSATSSYAQAISPASPTPRSEHLIQEN